MDVFGLGQSSLGVWVFVFACGAIIGSFFNVLIYRIPRDKRFGMSHSHCPTCKNIISVWDLIPILSYYNLKGRCRNCNSLISKRYPFVESLTGFVLCVFFWWIVNRPNTLYGWVNGGAVIAFFLAMIPITFIDFEHYLIPDKLSLPFVVIGFGISFLPEGITPLDSGLGLVLCALPLFLIGISAEKFFKKPEAMGGGDIKLMAAIGAMLGLKIGLLALLFGSVFASIAGIILLIRRGRQGDRRIAYGPYLCAGAIFAFYFGERLLTLYFKLVTGTLFN